MKIRMAALFLFAVALAAFATAQSQPDTGKHDPDTQDPLAVFKIAADVAGNVQGHAMTGYFAIYIDQSTWKDGLADGDLGPFVKFKEAKAGRSVVCIFDQNKDSATCVYFDSGKPFGVVALQADDTGKLDTSKIAGAYKDVSRQMLKKRDEKLNFFPISINSDDGQKLIAYGIAPAKSKN